MLRITVKTVFIPTFIFKEKNKAVPILSSSVYGKRNPIDKPSRNHYRIELVRKEFYRNGGANIATERD